MGVLKITAKVLGKREVKQWLLEKKRRFESPEFEGALSAGANVYVRGMKRRAPVDTGALAGSINRQRARSSETGFEIGPGSRFIPIYAAPQEFGAKGNPFMVFEGKDGEPVFLRELKPHPFVKPTWDQDTERAYEAFKDALFRDW